jgi:hypothetical protein
MQRLLKEVGAGEQAPPEVPDFCSLSVEACKLDTVPGVLLMLGIVATYSNDYYYSLDLSLPDLLVDTEPKVRLCLKTQNILPFQVDGFCWLAGMTAVSFQSHMQM